METIRSDLYDTSWGFTTDAFTKLVSAKAKYSDEDDSDLS